MAMLRGGEQTGQLSSFRKQFWLREYIMNQEEYDVVILGTGPAGLQAAIHAARAKVSVLVMGREQKSSLYKAHVDNYCCIT